MKTTAQYNTRIYSLNEISTEITKDDADQITEIYNYYVRESVATFDTEEWTSEKMMGRIKEISSEFPYLVCRLAENDGMDKGMKSGMKGKIIGYCYAHPWKEKDAYKSTLETTVYISPEYIGNGLGKSLMDCLIEECRKTGIKVLIACITEGNEGSFRLHENLGFERVSHFKKVGIKFGRWLDVVDYELVL